MKLPNYVVLVLALLLYNPYLLPVNNTLNKFITSGHLKYSPKTQIRKVLRLQGGARLIMATGTSISAACIHSGVGSFDPKKRKTVTLTLVGVSLGLVWDAINKFEASLY